MSLEETNLQKIDEIERAIVKLHKMSILIENFNYHVMTKSLDSNEPRKYDIVRKDNEVIWELITSARKIIGE